MLEKKYYQFRVWLAEVIAMLKRANERAKWIVLRRKLIALCQRKPFPDTHPVRTAYSLYYLTSRLADIDAYCHGLFYIAYVMTMFARQTVEIERQNRIDPRPPHTMQEILATLRDSDKEIYHAIQGKKDQD